MSEANVAGATALLGTMFPDAPAEAPVAEAPAAAPVAAAPVAAATAPEAQSSLAGLIRQAREERQARAAATREATDVKARLAEAESKLARAGKADIVGDPIGFAEANGLSPEEMALVGQAYLYHLVPGDKAPADLRMRLFEAKAARRERTEAAARTEAERATAAANESHQIERYTAVLKETAQSWEGEQHPFPESGAWFGGNHDEYAESLVATARNLANGATARGEVADLTPKAVAAALERDIAARAARFRSPGSRPAQASGAPVTPVGGAQATVLSTRGQGASPAPPATSEAERVRRATLAAFPAST